MVVVVGVLVVGIIVLVVGLLVGINVVVVVVVVVVASLTNKNMTSSEYSISPLLQVLGACQSAADVHTLHVFLQYIHSDDPDDNEHRALLQYTAYLSHSLWISS